MYMYVFFQFCRNLFRGTYFQWAYVDNGRWGRCKTSLKVSSLFVVLFAVSGTEIVHLTFTYDYILKQSCINSFLANNNSTLISFKHILLYLISLIFTEIEYH